MTISPPRLEPGDLTVRGDSFTIADRDALPDDGRRHELLDGVLVMSPSPRLAHQIVARALFRLLDRHAPRDLSVLFAPLDVRISGSERTALQPDLLVARVEDLDAKGFTTRPMLCVEIASPSTRIFDLGRKKELFADSGCPHYWTIEPDRGPELTVWRLDGDAYTVEAVVTGEEEWTAEGPFPLTIRPVGLLDD